MNVGDIVTIAPPFSDNNTRYTVSGIIDNNTSLIYVGTEHLAYSNSRLTVVDTGGIFPSPVFNTNWQITKLAFRNRFSFDEKVKIEMASLDNPNSSMDDRIKSASLRTFLADVVAASFIDLKRPDTRLGVQSLETMGLLLNGRAVSILDTPPSDIERYIV